jgi:hypothetical protein
LEGLRRHFSLVESAHNLLKVKNLAERGGFEPPVQLLTVQRFSKPPPSATRPPLRRVLRLHLYQILRGRDICEGSLCGGDWRSRALFEFDVQAKGPAFQCEMSSRAKPRVRGPKMPMASTTISMDAAIKEKTPATPKSRKKKPIRKLVKIALKRLHE